MASFINFSLTLESVLITTLLLGTKTKTYYTIMSNLNQDTQPKKPLGDGAKAGATSENRILYILLFVLIAVFFWKVSSDDDITKTIAQDNPIKPSIKYEEVTNTFNPNVDVEIMDADLLAITKVDASEQKEDKEQKQNKDIPEESTINPDFYKSFNLKQMPITNDGGFDNIPAYDYNYIFSGDINVPEGTFIGMDDNGYAILREKRTRTLLGGGMEQAQIALADEFYPKGGNIVYESTPSNTSKINEYPNKMISSETYPLDDNLVGQHPSESSIYLREQKGILAEKVKETPTFRDLEQYIPPSTLGDKDTRMGYGVVIRPRK